MHTTKQIKDLEIGDRIKTRDGLLEVLGVKRFKEGEGKSPIQVTFQDEKGRTCTTPYNRPDQLILVQGDKSQPTLF